MSKKAKWLLISLAVFLALELVAAVGIFGYLRPWKKAANTMQDKGLLELVCRDDETLTLSWPQGMDQDRYLVRILSGEDVL